MRLLSAKESISALTILMSLGERYKTPKLEILWSTKISILEYKFKEQYLLSHVARGEVEADNDWISTF